MFAIESDDRVDALLSIYTATGVTISTVDVQLSAGTNRVGIDNSFTPGVYVATVETGAESRLVKFVVN